MKRILIITYSYSPHLTPRALRWSAIARRWVKEGHKVDVVCSWDPGLARQELKEGVRVYRTGNMAIEKIRKVLRGQTAFNIDSDEWDEEKTEAVRGMDRGRRLSRSLIKWAYDNTWKRVYWPDYACIWYFSAQRLAQGLIKAGKYHALVTVSPPFSGHLVGLRLKRRWPDFRWIVDSGDPFCFADKAPMNNHHLYNRLNYAFERKVFDEADVLSVTTKRTAQIYSGIFSSSKSKIAVVPPLLNMDCSEHLGRERSLFGLDKIVFAYVGNLYRHVREPTALLKLATNLLRERPSLRGRIELHFYGDVTPLKDVFERFGSLRGIYQLHGPSPRSLVTKAMAEADILVNIGNATDYQLPSKVVEYASTGKPIINIYSSDEDSSVEFFAGYPLVLNVKATDFHVDAAALAEFIEESRGKTVDSDTLSRFIGPFQTEEVATQYLTLLNGN